MFLDDSRPGRRRPPGRPCSTISLACLMVRGQAALLQLVEDEGLEELEGHLLGQAALVQLEVGADHDDRAARVIHALAQQVLAEAALLALERVAQGLERPVVGALEHAAAAAVVEQRVHSLLKHALLVAHDHVGRAQLDELLQAVVAVDDAAVEVVQIARGEAAAVERHQGPQLGRDDRDHVQDHPLGLVAALAEGLHDLEALSEVGALLVVAQDFDVGPEEVLLALQAGQPRPPRHLARGALAVLAVLLHEILKPDAPMLTVKASGRRRNGARPGSCRRGAPCIAGPWCPLAPRCNRRCSR